MNSTELVLRLRDERSVLVVPGDHFGMDGYLRVGFGNEPRGPAGRPRAHRLRARRAGSRGRVSRRPAAVRLALVGFGSVGRRFAELLRGPTGACCARAAGAWW